jgi:predicted Zn-dependent peptidase
MDADDIKKAAKTYFNFDNYYSVTLKPENAQLPAETAK